MPRPGPEGVSEAVVEVEEAFAVHGQHVPGIVVDVVRPPHLPHQLPFRQLGGPAVAQERVAAQHLRQQEPGLPWGRRGGVNHGRESQEPPSLLLEISSSQGPARERPRDRQGERQTQRHGDTKTEVQTEREGGLGSPLKIGKGHQGRTRDRDKWWQKERDVSRTLQGPGEKTLAEGPGQETDVWEDVASTESSREQLQWTPRHSRQELEAGEPYIAERLRVPDPGQMGGGLRVGVRTAGTTKDHQPQGFGELVPGKEETGSLPFPHQGRFPEPHTWPHRHTEACFVSHRLRSLRVKLYKLKGGQHLSGSEEVSAEVLGFQL